MCLTFFGLGGCWFAKRIVVRQAYGPYPTDKMTTTNCPCPERNEMMRMMATSTKVMLDNRTGPLPGESRRMHHTRTLAILGNHLRTLTHHEIECIVGYNGDNEYIYNVMWDCGCRYRFAAPPFDNAPAPKSVFINPRTGQVVLMEMD